MVLCQPGEVITHSEADEKVCFCVLYCESGHITGFSCGNSPKYEVLGRSVALSESLSGLYLAVSVSSLWVS